MYPVSDMYLNAIESNDRESYLWGELILADGSSYWFDDYFFLSGSVSIEHDVVTGEVLEIGSAIASQFKATLVELGLSRYQLYNASITLVCETYSGNFYTAVPMGVYTVTEATWRGSSLEIKAVDNMYLLDVPLVAADAYYGDPWRMLNDLSAATGLEVAWGSDAMNDFYSLPNCFQWIEFPAGSGVTTWRDLLRCVTQILAGFAIINREGELEIRSFQTYPVCEIPENRCFSLAPADYISHHSAISVESGAETIEIDWGDGDLTLHVEGNPIFDVQSPSYYYGSVDEILSALYELRYTPGRWSYAGNPALDVGDMVIIADYEVLLTSITWRYHQPCELRSVGGNPRYTTVVPKRLHTAASQASAANTTATAARNTATAAINVASAALISADGKNKNYYGTATPTSPHLGDQWYKPNGDELELWVYESRSGVTQWYAYITDLTQEQMKQELATAKTMVEGAAENAAEALATGEAVRQEAEEAVQQMADEIAAVNATIGSRFNVAALTWQQGGLSATTGIGIDSTDYVRTAETPATPGGWIITQTPNGLPLSASYWWYQGGGYTADVGLIGKPLSSTQWAQAIATGTYTYDTITSGLDTDYSDPYAMSITASTGTNPFSSSADYLVIYRIQGVSHLPEKLEWYGRRETSTQTRVYLFTGSVWRHIATVTASANTRHIWDMTTFTAGIKAANASAGMDAVHVAFFSVKDSSYSGFYNQSAAPFIANPWHYLSNVGATTSAVAAPAGTTHVRAQVMTTTPAADFAGIVLHGQNRVDTTSDAVYTALSLLEHSINLRVEGGSGSGIINQINLSTEGILIAGNRIHVAGQTTIDSSVIKTAHIADAAITDAKIASLSAAKITTGTLSADRIAAGSITSAKLAIASGYITNAMIADATIASAKIAALDAAKITTGTLAAARIAAGSITADKLATNALQVGLAEWASTIRITPTSLSWYNGSSLEGIIDSEGAKFYYGTRFLGAIGEVTHTSSSSRRGIATCLNGQGDFVSWAYRTGTSGAFTTFLTLDPRNLLGDGSGVSFGTPLRLNGQGLYTPGGRYITLGDNTLSGVGTYPSLLYATSGAQVTFGPTYLYLVSNSTYYNVSYVVSRVNELISRMNTLIARLNNGWVVSVSGSGVSSTYYSNTGLSSMSTTVS